MFLIRIIEVLFVLLFVLFVVSQIVLPAVKNRALFPMFRKQGNLEKALSRKNQEKYESDLETKLNKTGEKK